MPPELTSQWKPAVAEFITLVSRRLMSAPMSSALPVRRRLNEGMWLASMTCRMLSGRKALSAKMVIVVGVPCSEPRGVL